MTTEEFIERVKEVLAERYPGDEVLVKEWVDADKSSRGVSIILTWPSVAGRRAALGHIVSDREIAQAVLDPVEMAVRKITDERDKHQSVDINC